MIFQPIDNLPIAVLWNAETTWDDARGFGIAFFGWFIGILYSAKFEWRD